MLNKYNNAAQNLNSYLTTEEACNFLKVGRTKLWKIRKKHKIPITQKNGKNLYKYHTLVSFIKAFPRDICITSELDRLIKKYSWKAVSIKLLCLAPANKKKPVAF